MTLENQEEKSDRNNFKEEPINIELKPALDDETVNKRLEEYIREGLIKEQHAEWGRELIKNGTFDPILARQSIETEQQNTRDIISFAEQFRGKTITPELIYIHNHQLLDKILFGGINTGNVNILTDQVRVENMFRTLGVDFKWEDIDLRKFEEAKEKYVDLKKSAELLENKLTLKKPGEISLEDIATADNDVLKKLMSYFKADSEQWTNFFKDFLPKFDGKIVLEKLDKADEGKNIKDILGKVLKEKAKSSSLITPYGIYLKDPRLYKSLAQFLKNDKTAWTEFMKKHVGESEASKFQFTKVDLNFVEKRRIQDKILKPLGGRLKTLISIVDSKKGSGGQITPESIYKYGKLYGINIYAQVQNVIGDDKSKWQRFFRKFVPNYKERFSYKQVEKGKIDQEIKNIDTQKKLGSNLKTLIDLKGPGEVTTKSIFKFNPGLFNKLHQTLGSNPEKWKTFMKENLGENYASRFRYVNFSRNQVEKEKEISAAKNTFGEKFENLVKNFDGEKMTIKDIKDKDQALYFALISILGHNNENWKQFVEKTLPENLRKKIVLKDQVNNQNKEGEINNNPFPFLKGDLIKINQKLEHMVLPDIITPRFFFENFPEDFVKASKELKHLKANWELYLESYFPDINDRFFWKQEETIAEDYLEDETKEKEINIAPKELNDIEKNALENFQSLFLDLVEQKLDKGDGKILLEDIIQENNILFKNLQKLTGLSNTDLKTYLNSLIKESGFTDEELNRISKDDKEEIILKEIKEGKLKLFAYKLEQILFDLTRENKKINIYDLKNTDKKLFSEMELFLNQNDLTVENFIKTYLESYYSKIDFSSNQVEEVDDETQTDFFGEEIEKEYESEKNKTIEAFKGILEDEVPKSKIQDPKERENSKIQNSNSKKEEVEKDPANQPNNDKALEGKQKIEDRNTEKITSDEQMQVEREVRKEEVIQENTEEIEDETVKKEPIEETDEKTKVQSEENNQEDLNHEKNTSADINQSEDEPVEKAEKTVVEESEKTVENDIVEEIVKEEQKNEETKERRNENNEGESSVIVEEIITDETAQVEVDQVVKQEAEVIQETERKVENKIEEITPEITIAEDQVEAILNEKSETEPTVPMTSANEEAPTIILGQSAEEIAKTQQFEKPSQESSMDLKEVTTEKSNETDVNSNEAVETFGTQQESNSWKNENAEKDIATSEKIISDEKPQIEMDKVPDEIEIVHEAEKSIEKEIKEPEENKWEEVVEEIVEDDNSSIQPESEIEEIFKDVPIDNSKVKTDFSILKNEEKTSKEEEITDVIHFNSPVIKEADEINTEKNNEDTENKSDLKKTNDQETSPFRSDSKLQDITIKGIVDNLKEQEEVAENEVIEEKKLEEPNNKLQDTNEELRIKNEEIPNVILGRTTEPDRRDRFMGEIRESSVHIEEPINKNNEKFNQVDLNKAGDFVEDLLLKKAGELETIDIEDIKRAEPEIYEKVLSLVGGKEEEFRRLVRIYSLKINMDFRNKKMALEEKLNKNERIKELEKEEIFEIKDEETEKEDKKEIKQTKKETLEEIIKKIIQVIAEKRSINISTHFAFILPLDEKTCKNSSNLESEIYDHANKVFAFGGIVEKIDISSQNYEDYLETATTDLIFEMTYHIQDIETEKNLWRFRLEKINLENIF